VVYDGRGAVQNRGIRSWYLSEFQAEKLEESGSEAYYQALWGCYFNQIAIATRTNARLQAQFIPQRYRRNLIEFQQEIKTKIKADYV